MAKPGFFMLSLVLLGILSDSAWADGFNNWEEFAQWCTSTGGTPVPNPPRCYPKSTAASAGSAPAAQAGAAIGRALGNAVLGVFQAGVAAAQRRQEIANEQQQIANRVAAERAAMNQNEAQQHQQAVSDLQGEMKSLDDDPQMGGQVVVQTNPGARTAAAQALPMAPDRGALPASSALGQLTNGGSESTGRLFDGGVTPTDATVKMPATNLATPPAHPVETIRAAVFPGMSSSDWSKLQRSQQGKSLIKKADALLARRDALENQIEAIKQTPDPSAHQQELISATNQQSNVTNQISALQPQAQQLVNKTVLDP